MKNIQDFIQKKWHLHTGLSITAAIWFLKLTDTYPSFIDIGNSGNFLQIFLTVFFCFIFATFVEWAQGKFYGANKTNEQAFQGRLDILASIAGSIIGTLIYFIFMKVSLIISVVFLATVLLIEYKRTTLKK